MSIIGDIIDDAAHALFNADLLRRDRRAICARCGYELATAYHEARLYSVECCKCKTITLAKARNPYEAAEKVGIIARPAEEWHEDYGDALWWSFPVEEPPYIGSPISYHADGSPTVPDCCTHWTPIIVPTTPDMEG